MESWATSGDLDSYFFQEPRSFQQHKLLCIVEIETKQARKLQATLVRVRNYYRHLEKT